MSTLQELKTKIDAGLLVERTGKHTAPGPIWFINELVYLENGVYVYARFESQTAKPGVQGFDCFYDLLSTDYEYYADGVSFWHELTKHVPFEPGNKFFYLWLSNWCEEWRKLQGATAQR